MTGHRSIAITNFGDRTLRHLTLSLTCHSKSKLLHNLGFDVAGKSQNGNFSIGSMANTFDKVLFVVASPHFSQVVHNILEV